MNSKLLTGYHEQTMPSVPRAFNKHHKSTTQEFYALQTKYHQALSIDERVHYGLLAKSVYSSKSKDPEQSTHCIWKVKNPNIQNTVSCYTKSEILNNYMKLDLGRP
jgi:hypothetical protein